LEENKKKIVIESLYSQLIDEEMVKAVGLLSEPLLREKAQIKAEERWQQLERILTRGTECFLQKLESTENSSFIYQELRKLQTAVEQQKDLKIPDSIFDEGLQIGKKLLEYEHFEESEAIFQLMTILAPEVLDFWFGLGMSLEGMGKFDKALSAFDQAFEASDQKHPLPLLFCVECFRKQGLFQEARQELKKAKEVLSFDSRYASYQQQVTLLEESI
jgi:tetratricopeptide (TPR) repeat protein